MAAQGDEEDKYEEDEGEGQTTGSERKARSGGLETTDDEFNTTSTGGRGGTTGGDLEMDVFYEAFKV